MAIIVFEQYFVDDTSKYSQNGLYINLIPRYIDKLNKYKYFLKMIYKKTFYKVLWC